MARRFVICALVALLLVLNVSTVCAEEAGDDSAVPSLDTNSQEAQATDETPAEGEEEDPAITNPNYEAELARLKTFCKTIKNDMKDLFLLKRHYNHEAGIMSHASDLGMHLDERHREWETTHHEEWNCKQAREVLAHEAAKKFVDHFENWYNGKDVEPPVSHAESLRLVRHLREEMQALRLMNDDTNQELLEIEGNLLQLEKWHLALRSSWDELQKDPDTAECEKPFRDFMTVLHELHPGAVPEWFHIAEGVQLLNDQCHEDPALNADL